MSPDLLIAYDRARGRFVPDLKLALSSREQAEAIYTELRLLDTERATGVLPSAAVNPLRSLKHPSQAPE